MTPTARVPVVLLAGLLLGTIATAARAQGIPGAACTQPLDPACNHLKCYQIKDKAIVGTTPKSALLQVDNQFGRELIYRLQPVLLCLPTQKACCNAAGQCSPANCQPNPVPAPGLPHFKCYRIKVKTCPTVPCDPTTVAKFAKGKLVDLRDQFGFEPSVAVGNPVLFCAPVDKHVVGDSTTTTTTSTTTSSTTTTTIICHFDSSPGVNRCVGPCPPNAPAGSQCTQTGPGKCDCVPPPVCCQCTTATGPQCFDSNNPCPSNCVTVPNADCDPVTHQCECGRCIDNGTCSNIPCSATQACPVGTTCDPHDCPLPCDPCAGQPAPCGQPCIRADGTTAQCRQLPGQTSCSCCGPAGSFCTTDFDCCSGVCNVSAGTCQ